MQVPEIDVVRNLSTRFELRAMSSSDGSLGLMTGHFSVFNVWYEVDSMWEGCFLERTAPGAFAQTIAEDLDDMRVLFDHGFDPQIGNKVLGPIESLSEDETGPAYEVPLFDTSYNRDLLPGLRATPSVYGSSFRFRVTAETWVDEPKPSASNPKGLPERTITGARVMEFGPVTFPANTSATAGVRSATDAYYDVLQARSPTRYTDLVARQRAIRTPDAPQAAPVGTARTQEAANTTDEPATRHSDGHTPADRRAYLHPIEKKAS